MQEDLQDGVIFGGGFYALQTPSMTQGGEDLTKFTQDWMSPTWTPILCGTE